LVRVSAFLKSHHQATTEILNHVILMGFIYSVFLFSFYSLIIALQRSQNIRRG